MYFADCEVYIYPIFMIMNIFIFILIVKLNKVSYILFNIIAVLFLGCVGLMYGRENMNVSIIGTVTSNIIKAYMKDFDREQYYIVDEEEFIVPDNYRNTVYNLSKSTIEVLENITKQKHDKVIYQLHGGAYIRPIANEYRDLAVKYSSIMMNADVATLDYRTAQKDVYPAALEDAVEGYEFLLKRYKAEDIVIAGDSAGGNLTLALTLYLRDNEYELPKGLIVMSPWADFSESGESYEYNLHKDIMFGFEEGEELQGYAIDNRYAGNADLKEAYLSPVYGEYHNFPPVLIQVGTYEVLESDSIKIYEKLKACGSNPILTRYEGMFHQFELYDFISESKQAWNEISDFYKSLYN